jgi:hypothetical protein
MAVVSELFTKSLALTWERDRTESPQQGVDSKVNKYLKEYVYHFHFSNVCAWCLSLHFSLCWLLRKVSLCSNVTMPCSCTLSKFLSKYCFFKEALYNLKWDNFLRHFCLLTLLHFYPSSPCFLTSYTFVVYHLSHLIKGINSMKPEYFLCFLMSLHIEMYLKYSRQAISIY